MAIGATTVWRVRAGGDEANGGGYDSAISGAGTDYTDQDAHQLSLTDFACVDSTTLTSATGGFTTVMKGNCIRISAGTNFVTGYYFVTDRTDTNTVTVDRKPVTNGTTGSGGVGRLGGAHASWKSYATGGTGGSPTITSPAAPGHTIYTRGSGSSDPSIASPDFDFSAGYWTIPDGDGTNGPISFLGYNGKPCIKFDGLLFYTSSHTRMEDLKFFVKTSPTYASYGFLSSTGQVYVRNCIVDANGQDAILITAFGGHILDSIFRNTGGGGASSDPTRAGIMANTYNVLIASCRIHGLRTHGIYIATGSMASVRQTLVYSNLGDGIHVNQSTNYMCTINDCTIDANGGHGIFIYGSTTVFGVRAYNNIISNHTTSGKKGIHVDSGSTATNDRLKRFIDYNKLYNNHGNYGNISAGANDQTIDPDFVNTGTGDYTPQETDLEGDAFPVSIP